MRRKDRRLQWSPVPDDRRAVSDRRFHERVMVNLEVDYQCDDTFLFAYITDLSAMGIFIQTNKPHPTGTQLNLHFKPAGGPELDLEARVMWVNPYRPDEGANLNPGMGLQFLDLTAPQREQIMKLVRTFAYLSDDDDLTVGNS